VTAGAAHELSTREIDKALTLLRGQSEKNFNEGMWAAATRADLGSPQVDKLDQWRKTNPQDWARGGAFIFYKLIYKLEEGYERGSYGYGREEELAQLLDIIEHYKTHNEQLTKELLRAEGGKQHEPLEPRLTLEPGFKEENEMNVEPWLPLSEIIFDTEQANQLAASVLATPGMGVASTAWATLRAGNLTSTQSTPRIPKRRKVESLGR
jgi:hypothetical protein